VVPVVDAVGRDAKTARGTQVLLSPFRRFAEAALGSRDEGVRSSGANFLSFTRGISALSPASLAKRFVQWRLAMSMALCAP
jgi:hypothetical protein